MSNPKTIEDIAKLGTVICPICGKSIDATDFQAMIEHIRVSHPEDYKKLLIDAAIELAVKSGILTPVDK